MANRYSLVRTLKQQGNPPAGRADLARPFQRVALPPMFLFNDIHGVFLIPGRIRLSRLIRQQLPDAH